MRNRRYVVLIAALSTLAGGILGCGRGDRAAALPPPPTGGVPEPKDQVTRYTALAPGVLAQTRYKGVSPDGYSIEIRDLLVTPQKTAAYRFTGATVVLVLAGSGSIALDNRRSELRTGAAFSVPERAPVNFNNGGAGNLTLRTITFTKVQR